MQILSKLYHTLLVYFGHLSCQKITILIFEVRICRRPYWIFFRLKTMEINIPSYNIKIFIPTGIFVLNFISTGYQRVSETGVFNCSREVCLLEHTLTLFCFVLFCARGNRNFEGVQILFHQNLFTIYTNHK